MEKICNFAEKNTENVKYIYKHKLHVLCRPNINAHIHNTFYSQYIYLYIFFIYFLMNCLNFNEFGMCKSYIINMNVFHYSQNKVIIDD